MDWEDYFQQLQTYTRHYGHPYVPAHQKTWNDLYNWTLRQRQAKALLTEEQVGKLDALGFNWTILSHNQLQWETRYRELEAFYHQHGHGRVPLRYPANPALGRWVSRQRWLRDTLSEKRRQRLERAGFVWKEAIAGNIQATWEAMYARLVVFRETQGHFRVYIRSDKQLAIWVSNQRQEQRTGKLSPDRLDRLEAIGFPWQEQVQREREDHWGEMYGQLLTFRQTYGHCRVTPKTAPSQLLAWVRTQRSTEALITKARKEKLDAIGFWWGKNMRSHFEGKWGEMHQQLVAFHAIRGHCQVSKRHPVYARLGRWVDFQKLNWQKLPSDRKQKLVDLGLADSVAAEKPVKGKMRRETPRSSFIIELLTRQGALISGQEIARQFIDQQQIPPQRYQETNKAIGKCLGHLQHGSKLLMGLKIAGERFHYYGLAKWFSADGRPDPQYLPARLQPI